MVLYGILVILNLLFICNSTEDQEFLIREISNGKLIGKKVYSTNGKIFGYAYTGIPYGSPPVGPLRFKAPLDPNNWDGIRNCTILPKGCFIFRTKSKNILYDTKEMSEDCLYLNVYTSKQCLINGKCPVVLYLYGGKFVTGSVKSFNETSLIENFANDERNIVFVNFNYRGGILGFLALNQKYKLSMNTNAAMYDVIAALKWIKKNVISFGGDKDDVTLMGHSSGGVIASYVYKSPRSKGLINKVIIMSATHRHVHFKDANEFYGRQTAIQAGCASYNTDWNSISQIESTLNCLRNLSLMELSKYSDEVEDSCWEYLGPSSDYESHSFMQYDWKKLSQSRNNIPILIGNAVYELQEGKHLLDSNNKVNIEKLRLYCNNFLSYDEFENPNKFLERCVEEYKNDSKRIIGIGDEKHIFLQNILISNEVTKSGGNVFLYQFSYKKTGEAIKPKNYPLTPHHSTELVYVIGLNKNKFTDKDYKIQEYHSRMYTNFIRNSNPSDNEIIFEKYDPEKNNYYNVDFNDNGDTISEMKDKYNEKALNFWLKSVGEYGHRMSEDGHIVIDSDPVYCPKKAPGSAGRTVKLFTNYFGLKLGNTQGTVVYQYEIETAKILNNGKKVIVNKKREAGAKTNE
uniref:Carboxylic ester hydrolase n=1 Tax=Strongyloides papillosus TaxID=174720 RepID=A0A0N5BIG7_STREA